MESLRQQLQPVVEARAVELAAFAELVQTAAANRQLPQLSDVPNQVLLTGSCATALVLLALLPRGRRLISDTVDTLLASVLLLVLIVLLLSLPFGTLYISYRGLLFLAGSLAESYPLLAKLVPQLPALI